MSDQVTIAPAREQAICIKCGFCCDGTMFLCAYISEGEKVTLPVKNKITAHTLNDGDYFTLPCGYFDTKCTIYESHRAKVCGDFRCQLLKDIEYGTVTDREAVKIVEEAVKMRNNLIDHYRQISGDTDEICFQNLLHKLGSIDTEANTSGADIRDYEILLVECNIFQALMTKHIKSKSDFDKMMGEEVKS